MMRTEMGWDGKDLKENAIEICIIIIIDVEIKVKREEEKRYAEHSAFPTCENVSICINSILYSVNLLPFNI